jgi:uncharacterized protein YjbI with pentapeptide repeats
LAVLVGIVLLQLLVLPWYAKGHKDEKGVVTYPNAALVNPILGGFGALFLIYAAIRQAQTASQQARIASDRHETQTKADLQRRITETFSKAVEQLGNENIEVRVGGIYTLERLAGEAPPGPAADGSGPDLYRTVMETLTAFVRERARWRDSLGTTADKADFFDRSDEARPPNPATDIAAVLEVILRRPEAARAREQQHRWYFDLRAGDLRGAYLFNAHLERADLSEAHLERAQLGIAHLEEAKLYKAHLEGAYLIEACLEGASLSDADFSNACLLGAHLDKAQLYAADLSSAEKLTQEQIDVALGDAATKLPEGLTRPAHWTDPTSPHNAALSAGRMVGDTRN